MNNQPFNKAISYCLLVGVGKREEDSDAMAISARDAEHIQRALTAFDIFSKEHIYLLTEEQATIKGVLEKLDDLAQQTKNEPADLVVLFFSGHGAVDSDNYYLICRDTLNNDLVNTAIGASGFVEKLKSIRCNKMLVLLDCCHAAGMADIPFDKSAILEQPNRVILTACASNQVSYLSNPVSVFTYALIEGLGGKFLNGADDKEVNVFNLAMDVRERVVALSELVLKPGTIQQPQLNVLENSGTSNFVLARYPLGGPREIKLFKDEFSALSYNGKELDMNIRNKKDNKERDRFNWLVIKNTINDIGDGNYIVQGVQGPVTINNGYTAEQLKDILMAVGAESAKNFQMLLKSKEDDYSTSLSAKLETAGSFIIKEKKNLEGQLDLLLQKKGHFESRKIINSDPGIEFSLIKEIEKIESEVDKIKTLLNKL